MASFPGAKVHRESRRKLGRGQSVQQTPVTITATAATVTVTFMLNRPCVINGMVPTVTSSGALSSQHVTSPTQFEQVFTITQAAATISDSGKLRSDQNLPRRGERSVLRDLLTWIGNQPPTTRSASTSTPAPSSSA